MKKRTNYLTDYVINQYPIKKMKDLVIISIDITENYLLILEPRFNYKSNNILSFSKKYAKKELTKITNLTIDKITDKTKMQNYLESFYNAYESLNKEEKNFFNDSFILRISDLEIIEKYKTHSQFIRSVRNSAIVKFCLKSGLINFIKDI